ncbi:N-acylethanolamine-hydrolyzing acid amidase-like isoform X2 [Mixophyes fleayi]
MKYQLSKSIICYMADIYLDFYVQEPYAGEMRGIAKTVGVRPCEVVLINLYYETIMACTSIITEDKEGNIYHGRNMDLFLANMFKKITMDVDFIKNGQIAYTGTTFVGFVGLWTGQSPYKFTISANSREKNNVLWKNTLSMLLNRSPVSWLIRNTLNEAPDYQSAVSQLSNTPIISEMYFTVAGAKPGEGAAITRDRNGAADVEHLNASNGTWFLLQTNYDRWLTQPRHDNRRDIGIAALNSTEQENINKVSLYEVLSIPKVLNRGTVHTTMMSAAFPQDYVSWIRVLKESNDFFMFLLRQQHNLGIDLAELLKTLHKN